MPLLSLDPSGYLPTGIHEGSLAEVRARFGSGSEARQQQMNLLQQVVEAAREYLTIKRVLVWGSFVTVKEEPADLDYSIVVSVGHVTARISRGHRRFLVPVDARRYYAVDRSHLVIPDYPLEYYIEKLDFFCHTRRRRERGIVEISLRGEFAGETR